MRRGCGANADDRAGQARLAQGFHGLDRSGSLFLGTAFQRSSAARRVAATRMGENTAQLGAPLVQGATDLQQGEAVLWPHSRAVAVAVNLYQDRDGVA